MLLTNNLSFARSTKNIFENISFSIAPGKIIQIKGNNGSGKTTFIKTILHILKPASGEIFWSGKNINKNIFEYYSNTTFIMDKCSSSSNLTVMDNIIFWKNLNSSKISKEQISLLLHKLNLKKYLKTKIFQLSSGEIKKLELLRLIIEQKKFWVIDEPYNHLDEQSINILNETFKDHIRNNGFVLFASHYDPLINNIEIINFS